MGHHCHDNNMPPGLSQQQYAPWPKYPKCGAFVLTIFLKIDPIFKMRFDWAERRVHISADMNITAFIDLIDTYQRLGVIRCSHLQGRVRKLLILPEQNNSVPAQLVAKSHQTHR
jgi:hypothetical protein